MIEIRHAREADARRMAEIYVDTWRDSYAGVVPDKVLLSMSVGSQSKSWTRAIKRKRELIMVAEDTDAGVVGLSSGGNNRDRVSRYKGEVYTLYIAADHQNRGVGRKLLRGLFNALKDNDCGGAVIWVLASNPARFFYEAVGGIRTDERDEKLWGVELHEIGYVWPDLAVTLADGGLRRQRRDAG